MATNRLRITGEEEMLDDSQASEQEKNEEKQESIQRLNRIAGGFHIADMLDIAGIFAMHLKDNWRAVLNQVAKFPMFLAAAMFAVIGAGFSIQKARLDGSTDNTEWAIVKTISAMLIAGAVGMALLGPMFGLQELAEIAPVIFAAVLGFQGVLNGVKAITNLIQANRTTDPSVNRNHHEQARGNALGMLVGLAITAAVVGVMIMKDNDLAWLGVGGTAVGALDTARRMRGSSKQKNGYTQLATEESIHDQVELSQRQHPTQRAITAPSTNVMLKQKMGEAKNTNTEKKKENNPTSPYQPIPKIQAPNNTTPSNVIPLPLPSVKNVSLGGTIKSADEIENQLKQTGTDANQSTKDENTRSRVLSYSSSSSDSD